MIRYSRQYDQFRCAPVALANATKWCGIPVSWKEHRDYFTELCQCEHPTGANRSKFRIAIRKLAEHVGLEYEYRDHLTLKMFDEQLDADKALIVNWLFSDDEDDTETLGHYFFVFKRTPCFYYVVNAYFDEPTVIRISRQRMSKIINEYVYSWLYGKRMRRGAAWTITKPDKPLDCAPRKM